MALVVPGYTPADGAAFNTSGWNTDMWSTTDGVSVYGEMNGHLQSANFDAAEKVQPRHIRPGEGFRSEFSGAPETLDFHQTIFGLSATESDWVPIPGASHRAYLGWTPTCTMLRASCFVTNFRMRQGPAAGQDPVVTGPEEYITLFVDGVRVPNTLRRLPISHWPDINPGDAKGLLGRETILTHHFDFMILSGAMTVGYHDVDIRVQVPQNLGSEQLFPLYNQAALAITTHSVTHRIRGGIRSASIIALY